MPVFHKFVHKNGFCCSALHPSSMAFLRPWAVVHSWKQEAKFLEGLRECKYAVGGLSAWRILGPREGKGEREACSVWSWFLFCKEYMFTDWKASELLQIHLVERQQLIGLCREKGMNLKLSWRLEKRTSASPGLLLCSENQKVLRKELSSTKIAGTLYEGSSSTTERREWSRMGKDHPKLDW